MVFIDNHLLIIGLLCNGLGVLCWMIFVKATQKKMLGLLFLSLPIVGFLVYGFTQLVLDFYITKTAFDRAGFTRRLEMRKEVFPPQRDAEMNIISVADALAVSKNSEKRALLIEQLKLDMNENYKVLLAASDDEDSESSHYIAASKMAIYTKLYNQIQTAAQTLKNNLEDIGCLCAYLDTIKELIESKLLASSEQKLYMQQYCKVLDDYEYDTNTIAITYYEFYIKYLTKLEKHQQILSLWETLDEKYKSEYIYIKILEVYHQHGTKEQFYHTLDELCSARFQLSHKGLEVVRFWLNERKNNVIS